MAYQTDSQIGFYLLSIIQFDIGSTPVLLHGGIALTSDHAEFVMGTEVPFSSALFPGKQFTQSIPQPFGMTGVTLKQLEAKGVFSKNGDVSLSLDADAAFSGLNNFKLTAACVFDNLSPRLIVVELVSNPVLTLTQFITDVLGSSWSFADSVTDEFAFQQGQMYYLSEPSNAPPNYTFPYTLPGDQNATVFKPGYHIIGQLQIFSQYNFVVALDVAPGGIHLSTTVTTPIDIIEDVVTLKNPSLAISTIAPNKYLKISSNIILFSSEVDVELVAEYLTGQSLFQGEVGVQLNNVAIPNMEGNNYENVNLTFQFQWSKSNGFNITNINGLPANSLKLLDKYYQQFQKMGGGGCQAIVKSLISDLDKTDFTVALNGTPKKNGGNLDVPVRLTYKVLFAGSEVASATIDLTPSFPIPTSLDALPGDFWQWFVDNAGTLTEQILSNPQTYKAITIAAANKGLGSLAARLLCKALKEFGETIAEDIANAIAGATAETLAGALELAGSLAMVALAGVGGVVSGLLSLLKSIWDWLTGQDDKKKKEAEDKIRAAQQKVDDALNKVFTIIDHAKEEIQISALTVGINSLQEFEADWDVVSYPRNKLGNGANLSYVLELLSGEPGAANGTQIGPTQTINSINQVTYTTPLNSIPGYVNYQLNASISTKLTGVAFLDSKTKTSIQDSIDQLNGSGNSVAEGFAKDLQKKLTILLGYNATGLVSARVYASLPNRRFKVGQSLIGLTSQINTQMNT